MGEDAVVMTTRLMITVRLQRLSARRLILLINCSFLTPAVIDVQLLSHPRRDLKGFHRDIHVYDSIETGSTVKGFLALHCPL